MNIFKFCCFLFILNLNFIFIECIVNINNLDLLREAIKTTKNATIAFYARANLVSTSSLFRDIKFNYEIVGNDSLILDGVKNGKYLAGCVNGNYDKNIFNIIKTGVISGHAVFILPDKTSEYPHGASVDRSRKDFRNVINLAILNLQTKSIDFDLAKQFNKPITDLRTCKLNNPDEFPIPNRASASGILKDILNNRVLLVGSYGDPNSSSDIDENNDEFPFHSAYLNAILKEFSILSGSDKVPYGEVNITRVYAKSSTPNLLRDRIHMTEPYFLIDNVYSGSKETCNSDFDCVEANTATGHEECKNSICVSYSRPITDMFKISCLTYGTENLFITKITSKNNNDSNNTQSSGIIAAIVILSILVLFSSLFIMFIIWRERLGTPLFVTKY